VNFTAIQRAPGLCAGGRGWTCKRCASRELEWQGTAWYLRITVQFDRLQGRSKSMTRWSRWNRGMSESTHGFGGWSRSGVAVACVDGERWWEHGCQGLRNRSATSPGCGFAGPMVTLVNAERQRQRDLAGPADALALPVAGSTYLRKG